MIGVWFVFVIVDIVVAAGIFCVCKRIALKLYLCKDVVVNVNVPRFSYIITFLPFFSHTLLSYSSLFRHDHV